MNLPARFRRILVPCALLAMSSAALAAPVPADTYEVVQLARMDPPANSLRSLRDHAYKACTDRARKLNLPVLPFPALPGTQEERITTITNGVSSIVKRELIEVKYVLPLEPEGGCKVEMGAAPVTITVITHGASVTTLRSDSAAVTSAPREHEPPLDFNMQAQDSSMTDYTVPMSINGVDMRCVPAVSHLLRRSRFANMVDLCVYAQERALYLDLLPMFLYSHSQLSLITPDYAYNFIIEPLSVRRLPQGAADPFTAALKAARTGAR